MARAAIKIDSSNIRRLVISAVAQFVSASILRSPVSTDCTSWAEWSSFSTFMVVGKKIWDRNNDKYSTGSVRGVVLALC